MYFSPQIISYCETYICVYLFVYKCCIYNICVCVVCTQYDKMRKKYLWCFSCLKLETSNHNRQVCSKNLIYRIMICTMILSWMSCLISDVLSNVWRMGPWSPATAQHDSNITTKTQRGGYCSYFWREKRNCLSSFFFLLTCLFLWQFLAKFLVFQAIWIV